MLIVCSDEGNEATPSSSGTLHVPGTSALGTPKLAVQGINKYWWFCQNSIIIQILYRVVSNCGKKTFSWAEIFFLVTDTRHEKAESVTDAEPIPGTSTMATPKRSRKGIIIKRVSFFFVKLYSVQSLPSLLCKNILYPYLKITWC